jgi:hypothetical protein
MFHMANDSGLFRTRDQLERDGWTLTGNVFVRSGLRMLPLYEAKMIHHFDSRFATYEGATQAQINKGTLPRLTSSQHLDPECLPLPRYWVYEAEVERRLTRRNWGNPWLLGWRDISWSTNERTMICSLLPRVAVGHTFPLMLSTSQRFGCLYANLTSFAFDYVVRQKMAGTHLTYGYVAQWPIFAPRIYEESPPWDVEHPLYSWIESRVLELSYTAYDLTSFAVGLGDDGTPFRYAEERRSKIQAELDAAFFHLYGVGRDDLGYIMGSFRAFQSNDYERFHRTKELILDVYDAMAEAIQSDVPYQTILDPPPGHGLRHPAKREP